MSFLSSGVVQMLFTVSESILFLLFSFFFFFFVCLVCWNVEDSGSVDCSGGSGAGDAGRREVLG